MLLDHLQRRPARYTPLTLLLATAVLLPGCGDARFTQDWFRCDVLAGCERMTNEGLRFGPDGFYAALTDDPAFQPEGARHCITLMEDVNPGTYVLTDDVISVTVPLTTFTASVVAWTDQEMVLRWNTPILNLHELTYRPREAQDGLQSCAQPEF